MRLTCFFRAGGHCVLTISKATAISQIQLSGSLIVNENCPLVSIITPVYNAEKFLCRVVKTTQYQEGCTFEHILVDDVSTDSSYELMARLAAEYPNIRIARMKENSGPLLARNLGIELARGKYLAFLDADDYWLPDKLRIQVEFMQRHRSHLSFTDYRFISESGNFVGEKVVGPDRVGYLRHLTSRYGLGCLTVMVDAELVPNFTFESTAPITSRAEDFHAWMCVIESYGAALRVPVDLARYSVVPNSRSSSQVYKGKVIWKIYKDVYKLKFPCLFVAFVSFAISAWLKRYMAKPHILISVLDGQFGDEWLELVQIGPDK